MTRCEWTDACPFFSDEVGYSIDLQAQMRIRYCMGDNTDCARLRSIEYLPLNKIPFDLIPTEHERLDKLIEDFETEMCAKCKNKHPGTCC